MLNGSVFPNFGQGPFPKIAGKGPDSAIFLTFIKLPFVIKTFVLSIFVWRFNTGFTVLYIQKFWRIELNTNIS